MKKSGFTLIETIIYLALLSFLIGSGVAVAFMLADSSQKTAQDALGIEEANFLLHKFEQDPASMDLARAKLLTTDRVTIENFSVAHLPEGTKIHFTINGKTFEETK